MGVPNNRIADALRTQKGALATALVESIREWDKYAHEFGNSSSELQEFVRRELVAFVDYLIFYFERGDDNYRSLYIGEKLKQCFDSRDSAEKAMERREIVTQSDRRILLAGLANALSAADFAIFTSELDSIHAVVNGTVKRRARVLLIGDCLHLDIVSFLTGPLLEHGIGLEPTFVTSKNPTELSTLLRNLQGKTFDLIFYSPFTYEMQLGYSAVQSPRNAFVRARKLAEIAQDAISEVKGVLHLLGNTFEAPTFVHNSANIRRHDTSIAERAKSLITSRARRYTRKIVNRWLPSYLDELNTATFRHLFVLDEAALLGTFSEDYLGRLFYNSDLQHPAQFGKLLAGLYETAILTQCNLATRKVIACDLDNTLWDGVIGEGAVTHYQDRQQILRGLRQKGLLLVINSKNDPKNVRWTGAVLGPDDFAAAQINWQPKVSNLQRIAQDLNLKTKDFLFLDDRADERAMVSESMPEVHSLDAESPKVWRQLALLAHMLPEQSETDRTLAYKQREQRQEFLEQAGQEEIVQQDLFRNLGLTVSIRPAERKELKRVVELINRTNQFNMCGSRTTFKQINDWHQSSAHCILAVEAGDKFGSMGIVSVIVLDLAERSIDIPIFVLSCRVFGFGVETCVLNYVKRLAGHIDGAMGRPVRGHLSITPHNAPCHGVYPDQGFVEESGAFIYCGGGAIEDPEWMTVDAAVPHSLLRQ